MPMHFPVSNIEYQIIAAILVHSEEAFVSQVQRIQSATDFFQLDIADGIFVENTTWHDPIAIRESNTLDFELHMMVSDPLSEITRWIDNTRLKRIIVHAESLDNLPAAIAALKEYGREICVCLNPETESSILNPILTRIHSVQFMTIHPGKQGQPFVPEVLNKIKAFRAAHPNIPIAADGHINETTLPQLIESGVHRFGIGSGVFANGEPAQNIERFETILTQLTGEL